MSAGPLIFSESKTPFITPGNESLASFELFANLVGSWPVLGGTVWTVPGTVHSTPEKDPRKVFIGGTWAVGTPGMECLSEGIQTYTPVKPRGPGPI